MGIQKADILRGVLFQSLQLIDALICLQLLFPPPLPQGLGFQIGTQFLFLSQVVLSVSSRLVKRLFMF
jgi:hypothetical protein